MGGRLFVKEKLLKNNNTLEWKLRENGKASEEQLLELANSNRLLHYKMHQIGIWRQNHPFAQTFVYTYSLRKHKFVSENPPLLI